MCTDAGCVAGTPPELDDGIDCTLDTCDEDGDVVLHIPDAGLCDDGMYCDGIETCDVTSGCVAGTPPVLDDGVDCTVDTCDDDADTVVHTPDDSVCDDGAFCNGAEVCDAVDDCSPGTPPVVDDGVACTTDSCDEALDAVVNAPDDGACDDSDACTTDACTAGVGCAHPFTCACTTPADCDDSNPCTNDACTAGSCVYTNNTASCDDGLYCDGADVCAGGACTHAGDPCAGGAVCASTCNETADNCFAVSGASCPSDGNPCTTDACNGTGTCGHAPNTASCSDGLYCNGVDVCAGGTCTHPGDPCAAGAVCADTCNETADSCATPSGVGCTSDSNTCTTDACNGSGSCAHTPNTLPCDDGLYCNGADACSGGSCVHAGNPCTGGAACNDTCSEAADNCYAPAGAMCTDDGMACTTDACNGTGTCTHTTTPESACGNATDDDCDGMTDCADSDCAGAPCGPGGATCSGSTCTCPGGATETMCTNASDDDCDGAADCADSDCASAAACSCTRTRCTPGTCSSGLTCLAGTCGHGGTYGWDHAWGAASSDTASSVVATSAGYYVTGSFYGMVDFGGGTRTAAGSADGYLVALNADGTYRWDRTYGGTLADATQEAAADATGNVIVVGYQTSSGSFQDGTVRKVGASGTEAWLRTYGTDVVPTAVAVDSTGAITVTGYFNGSVDFGGGVRTAVSDPDIFVLGLTSAGAHSWDHTFDGGGTFDAGYAVAADADGNVYVGGVYGSQIDFGGGPTAMRFGGAFVASFDRAGVYRWDRDFGAGQPDDVSAIAVSQLGDVVVAGSFGSTVDFGGGPRSSSGFVDGVVWVLDTDGTYRWDHEYGASTSDDRVDGIAVDCAGNIVATGMFQGAVDFGGGSRTSSGGRDVFVLSLARSSTYRWDRTFGGTGADRGSDAVLTSMGRVAVTGTFSSTVNFGGGGRTSAGLTDGFVLELAD